MRYKNSKTVLWQHISLIWAKYDKVLLQWRRQTLKLKTSFYSSNFKFSRDFCEINLTQIPIRLKKNFAHKKRREKWSQKCPLSV